jgi:hypothetical protein
MSRDTFLPHRLGGVEALGRGFDAFHGSLMLPVVQLHWDGSVETIDRCCHIRAGTGPTPATSAPGLGSPRPHHLRDLGPFPVAVGNLREGNVRRRSGAAVCSVVFQRPREAYISVYSPLDRPPNEEIVVVNASQANQPIALTHVAWDTGY